ncbi:MAG: DUF4870 domain-containing protein [Bacillaceae bacterium]|nr:DUF4870 domain-containing protein [Bacillaceae bacterium]
MSSSDERLFAMLIYLSSFFTAFIGPLVLWLIKKDESEFVDFHGRQYMNFLISYAIYGIISAILVIVLVGIFLVIAVSIAGLIFTILAAVKAYDGERYQIPFIIRFL